MICETGPPGDTGREDAWHIVVQGLRQIARKAAGASHRPILIGLEPSALDDGAASLVTSLSSAAALIDEVAEDNVKVMLDTWQLNGTFDAEEIGRFVKSVIGVQISDRLEEPRGPSDRLLPGDGVLDLRTFVAALHTAGYQGWYELEIDSNDETRRPSVGDSRSEIPPIELAQEARNRFNDLRSRSQPIPP